MTTEELRRLAARRSQKRYRLRHPESVANEAKHMKARYRAMARMAKEDPEKYAAYYEQERVRLT